MFHSADLLRTYRAFLATQMAKNLPAMQETRVQSLGWEDHLEKEMATHSMPREFHGQKSLLGHSPMRSQRVEPN